MWTLYKEGNARCRCPKQECGDLAKEADRLPHHTGMRAHLARGCWEKPWGFVGQEVPGEWVNGRSRQERKSRNGALSKVSRPVLNSDKGRGMNLGSIFHRPRVLKRLDPRQRGGAVERGSKSEQRWVIQQEG